MNSSKKNTMMKRYLKNGGKRKDRKRKNPANADVPMNIYSRLLNHVHGRHPTTENIMFTIQ